MKMDDPILAKTCAEHEVSLKLPTMLHSLTKQQAIASLLVIFDEKWPNELKSVGLESENCIGIIVESCEAEVLPKQPVAMAGVVGATDGEAMPLPSQLRHRP